MLRPNLIIKDVFAINLAQLKERGIKGLLIDLDNTLVPWEESVLDHRFSQWIKLAKTHDFNLCLVSNAVEKRAQSFARLLEIPAVGRAFKPAKRAFLKGVEALDLPLSQVAVVGDQLFTDVLGGNRLGLYTILVNPLSKKELGFTKIMRKIETTVLKRMVRKNKVNPEDVKIRLEEI